MSIWTYLPLPRLDLVFQDLLMELGPLGVVLALLVIGYVVAAPLVRALLVTVFTLVCTQTWLLDFDVQYFAYKLRWTLVLVLFVRGVVYVIRTRSRPEESRTARRLVFALGALALLSTVWSASTSFTLKMAALFCVGLFVTFGLLWRLADGDDVMRPVSRGAMAFAIVTMGGGFAMAAAAWLTSSWMVLRLTRLESGDRYQGIFVNPNAAGVFGAILLPIIVAAPREMLGRLASVRVPVCGLIAATIYLSGSRTALIGAAMALVILAMYRYGVTAFFTVALSAIAVAAVAMFAPLDDIDVDATPFAHIARTKHLSTLSGRLDLWQQGWDEAQGHLLLGQGWGHSRNIAGDVDLDRAELTGHVAGATNLHNAHLQLLIDVGFVGVGIFWAFCIAVLRAGWTVLRAPRSPENGLALVLFTSALALMADTWVHGAIWSVGNPTTLAFWSLCVMTLKQAGRIQAAEREREAAARPRPAPPPPERLPLPA